MPIDPNVVAGNASQRRRLETLVSRLTSDDRELASGWTVAATLAHLAFWDRRAALLLRRWEQKGTPPDEPDVDLLNEALLEEWRALPVRRAGDLAVSAARAVDAVVEALDTRVVSAVTARGEGWRLQRSNHRREHLGEIERVMQG
jgi:hypothetical protein